MLDIRRTSSQQTDLASTTTACNEAREDPPEEPPKTADTTGPVQPDQAREIPYTVLSEKEKIMSISIAAIVSFMSPVSANIYYPAVNLLSRDLDVSRSTINLTVTAFMVGRTCLVFNPSPLADVGPLKPAHR